MKTWIVLANAETARFFVNSGPGKGLQTVGQVDLHAEPPTPYTDRAGAVHSRVGPGVSAVEQTAPKELAETEFADTLCGYLQTCFEANQFDSLVIVAGPHMLGNLRKPLPKRLAKAVVAEIDKDLKRTPIKDLPGHLEDMIKF